MTNFDRYHIIRAIIITEQYFAREIASNPLIPDDRKHYTLQMNNKVYKGIIDRLIDEDTGV